MGSVVRRTAEPAESIGMRVRSAQDQMSTLQSHTPFVASAVPLHFFGSFAASCTLSQHVEEKKKNTSAFCMNVILAPRLRDSEFEMLWVSAIGLL